MRDIVTHCQDTAALLAEVAAAMPERVIFDDATGDPLAFRINKTPTKRNGTETLALVRVDDTERDILAGFTNLSLLVDVPAYDDYLTAMSPANRAVYDSVHDQTPQTVDDGAGGTITVTPSPYIGRFM